MRDTASGSYFEFQLRHSEHPTSDTGFSSWPTPTNSDDVEREPGNVYITKNGTVRHKNSEGQQSFMRFSQVVKIDPWPTPTVNGNNNRAEYPTSGGDGLARAVKIDPWATPQARDFRHGSQPNSDRLARKAEQGWSENLNDQVLKPWATPANRDWRDGKASERTLSRNSRPLNEQVTAQDGNQLNPDWEETLMGFPIGWTAIPSGPRGEDNRSTIGNRPEPSPPIPVAVTGWRLSVMPFRLCTHIRFGLR